MEKSIYKSPELEIITLTLDDVITKSLGDNFGEVPEYWLGGGQY